MTDYSLFLNDVKEKGIEIKKDLPMCDYTTFRIGGNADLGVFPKGIDELVSLLECASRCGIPYYLVGKGSNLLVSDEGYRGLVIFTGGVGRIGFEDNEVYAEAGASITSLSRAVAARGLSGLEFACGIPGTVGGAIYMNAGAYGSEMKNVTLYSDWWSPTEGYGRYVGEEQCFGYRESAYSGSDKVILGCRIALTQGDSEKIDGYCRELLEKRRDKQPLEFPSAGSTFKRYPGRFTGQMIEEAGLKGYRIGGAEVSVKHAGFVINRGGATAQNVIDLLDHIKKVIYEREGVMIEAEVRYLTPKGEEKL